MEWALGEALQKTLARAQPKTASHRIPLGLLLLSRHQLTAEQLRAALEAQRTAGRGRIGEWLQAFGYVSEQQITVALGRQWSCPVLQTAAPALSPVLRPEIPLRLLDLFRMIPVCFVASTETLHMAFGEGIDYAALYAIEQMLNCRTQPCVVGSRLLRESLLALGECRSAREVVFDGLTDVAELVRIICSYATRLSAHEIRLTSCRQYSWVRLEYASQQALNLLLRVPVDPVLEAFAPAPDLAPAL